MTHLPDNPRDFPLAQFFERLYLPLQLRNRSGGHAEHYRGSIRWLERVLSREATLADLNYETVELTIERLATIGVGYFRLRDVRKKLIGLWRYAVQLGLLQRYDPPPPPRPREVADVRPEARAWLAGPPQPGELLHWYQHTFRPQAVAALSHKETQRHDQAVNYFHDFAGRRLRTDEVTPLLIEQFRAWLDSQPRLSPIVRDQLRGCVRRMMRTFAPDVFPLLAGPTIKRPLVRERELAPSKKFPLPTGEPGTVVHFWCTSYAPEVMASAVDQSRHNYHTLFRKMRRCFGRDVRIDELTRELVNHFTAWMAELGNKPRTVKNERARLLAIWRYASEVDLAPAVPAFRPIKFTEEEPDAWTIEEAGRIVAAARDLDRRPIGGIPTNVYWPALLLTCWWTALRRKSLLRIRLADVDEAGWLYVPASKMKNRRGKRFKLGDDALRAIAATLPFAPDRELLFPRPPELGTLSKQFKAILDLAGVSKVSPLTNSLFHKFRRTVATATAVRAGLPAATALLGHSGPYVTQRYIDPTHLSGTNSTDWLPPLVDLDNEPPAIGGTNAN
jgi:integrase